eukprot:263015_1
MEEENTNQRLVEAGCRKKLGILLVNLGGPGSQKEVAGFLKRLFSDPDIIRLPRAIRWLQVPIASTISTLRAPKTRRAYKAIGGGSPILLWTEAQASILQSNIRDTGLDATVYVAMRYSRPNAADAKAAMTKDGIDVIAVLPLYPHYSFSTTESSLRELLPLLKSVPHTVVGPSWHHRQGYVDAMAGLIVCEIQALPPPRTSSEPLPQLLFSAHGVPKVYIEEGDPYKSEIEACVKNISFRVKQMLKEKNKDRETPIEISLAYQSRVGPVEWLKPYTDKALKTMGMNGVKSVVVVPVSFVSEHIETLEELDIRYAEIAHSLGIWNFRRVPALNTHPTFIMDLSSLVLDAVSTYPILSIEKALAMKEKSFNSPVPSSSTVE